MKNQIKNYGLSRRQDSALVCYAPAIFSVGGGGGGGGRGGAYSITTVCTYVRPVHNTNGFRAISFEKIGILD